MNRRKLLTAVVITLSSSVTVFAQNFGSHSQEMSPRGLALLMLAGIFILYKLLGIRL